MFVKKIVIGTVAAAALSLFGYAASAEPAASSGLVKANPNSTFTLIKQGGGIRSGGMRMGGMRTGGMHMGGMRTGGVRMGAVRTGPARLGVTGGYRTSRLGFRNGRRGYWRGGRWFWGAPLVGYSDSCYWNCINAGYGPAYCQVYSYNFCY